MDFETWNDLWLVFSTRLLFKENVRLKEELAQGQEGRDWWACVQCGERYHGLDSEAPFHTHDTSEFVTATSETPASCAPSTNAVCHNCGE